VYALTELVVKPRAEPRIRSIGADGPLVPLWRRDGW